LLIYSSTSEKQMLGQPSGFSQDLSIAEFILAHLKGSDGLARDGWWEDLIYIGGVTYGVGESTKQALLR
jgi:hypothetical protein